MSLDAVEMSMKSNGPPSLSPIMERHTPQHPLPDEIQNMQSDQTVCQFCGVSYLIHHEIKKLEEQVSALEEELSQCRASRENEKKLREELKKTTNGLQSLQSMLSEKDSTIDIMTRKIQGQMEKIEEITKEKMKLENMEISLKKSFRNHQEMFQSRALNLLHEVKTIKSELKEFRANVQPLCPDFLTFTAEVKYNIESIVQKCSSENSDLRKTCESLQEKLASKCKNEDLLQHAIAMMQNELKSHSEDKDKITASFGDEMKSLQDQLSSLQSKNLELSQDVTSLQCQLKIAKSDSIQIKDGASKKQQEIQSVMQKLHKTEQHAQMTIQRMNQEIRHLEQELSAANKERQSRKLVEEDLKKQQDEMRMQMSMNSGESQQLHQSLQEAKNELTAIKNEREHMILSHQNQITQLRDSFREKLDAAQGNPLEMQRRIQELEKRHEVEIKEQEMHLQESFAIELDLEREKHEEEIKNYKMKFKELMEQNESDIDRDMRRQASESRMLQQQMKAMKQDFTQQMSEQEKEKSSLKNIISQLEERITQLTGEHEEVAITSQTEVKHLRSKLQDAEKENYSKEQENSALKEEISVLQETVRRECEERFELTEALSLVREQLNTKKSTMDSKSLRSPVSAINGKPDVNHLKSRLSSKTLKSLESESSLPDVLPRQAMTGLRSSSDLQMYSSQDVSTHVRDLTFVNHTSQSPGKYPNGHRASPNKSEESVESVRRRIAAVIKRK